MLDLKAKLLAAGLVTKEQVAKVEAEKQAKADRQKNGPPRLDPAEAERQRAAAARAQWEKRLVELRTAGKGEQYDAIRGWVVRNRLDAPKAISESAQRFHFLKPDQTIGHITVEPDLQARLAEGAVGIVSFMGNNGLELAVVPQDLARDIASLRPDWLRVLHGVTDLTPAGAADEVAPAGAPAPDDEPQR